MHPCIRTALLGLVWLCVMPATGGSLLQDFERARLFDPDYATALTEDESARLNARIASMAFFPRAQFSATQLDNESEPRQTIAISQPLLDAGRWYIRQEAEPRRRAADAALHARTNALAIDVYRAVGDYVREREKLKLSDATIATLTNEVEAAEHRFERGVGTVTDVYDTRLRLAEARAERLARQSALDAARRQYASMIGDYPDQEAYRPRLEQGPVTIPEVAELLAQGMANNPQIESTRINIELTDLNRRRNRAEYFPSLNARAQRSWSDGSQGSSSGLVLSLDLPLDAGRAFQGRSAALDGQRARQEARATEQRLELEILRLHSAFYSTQARLATLREAIAAAELSVAASERSFEGGVRSKLDVINAILALERARANEIEALIDFGEIWLTLQLRAAVDFIEALARIQAHIFAGRL